MPKVSEMYPSKWLAAIDLADEEHVFTISSIEQEKIGQDQKWVMYFKRVDKGLVLNKTNMNTIAQLYGDDTDDWEGKAVTLYPTFVDYQGKQVEAIRIKPKVPKARKPAPAEAPAAAPAKVKPMTQEEVDEDEDAPPF